MKSYKKLNYGSTLIRFSILFFFSSVCYATSLKFLLKVKKNREIKHIQFRRNLMSLMTTFKDLIGISSFYQSCLEQKEGPAVAISLWGSPVWRAAIIDASVTYFLGDLSDAVHISEAITSYNAFCSLRCGYLAAIPPWRRLDTLGFPSLSIPPDTVSPRVVPSFFINSTIVEPLNSSVERKLFTLLKFK